MFEWILTIFSLLGTWFNIRKNIYCWPLWTIANVGWVYSFGTKRMLAESILFSVYFLLSTYGWYKWHQDNRKKNIRVDSLKK